MPKNSLKYTIPQIASYRDQVVSDVNHITYHRIVWPVDRYRVLTGNIQLYLLSG